MKRLNAILIKIGIPMLLCGTSLAMHDGEDFGNADGESRRMGAANHGYSNVVAANTNQGIKPAVWKNSVISAENVGD
jgi:hypothetical protein